MGITSSRVSSLNSHQSEKAVHLHSKCLERLDMTARFFCENPTCSSSRFKTLTAFGPSRHGRNLVLGRDWDGLAPKAILQAPDDTLRAASAPGLRPTSAHLPQMPTVRLLD